jgi:hypothetical protein
MQSSADCLLSHCAVRIFTSSVLLGLVSSSAFLTSFGFRLSLLVGRVGSAALPAGRAEVGVLPLAALELEAMAWGCCELLAAWADEMDDDECLRRAVAGGVAEGEGEGAGRVSMLAAGGGGESKTMGKVGG